MEDLVTIQGYVRTGTGKGFCRKLRNEDKVPANLLGVEKEKSLLELDAKWLSKAWQNGKKFNLKLCEETKAVEITNNT